ncbi:hypothetical protein F5877DRAFT_82617 [Lentinula edodes]|nr:hypothetical protein F5877DRAFT_82617 [Lentinula edodes]
MLESLWAKEFGVRHDNILRQWRRGKSPIPDPPALASDDEELEAGLTSLFQNKSVTSNEKAKTVESANDTTYEGKGKFKAQEGSSFLPDEQPPAKRRRKALFLSDSEDEGAEEDEDSVGNCEDNYFPGLQTAIANTMAGSSSLATNATLLPDLGGPSATDTSGSVSASTSHTPDVLLPDAEVEESERPLWLTDSLHYMRRYNFTSSTFSSDRPKFKF